MWTYNKKKDTWFYKINGHGRYIGRLQLDKKENLWQLIVIDIYCATHLLYNADIDTILNNATKCIYNDLVDMLSAVSKTIK